MFFVYFFLCVKINILLNKKKYAYLHTNRIDQKQIAPDSHCNSEAFIYLKSIFVKICFTHIVATVYL